LADKKGIQNFGVGTFRISSARKTKAEIRVAITL
jgi:hypothetical protein